MGIPWTVERYLMGARKRVDLFNIIDILVLADETLVGVQSCGTNFSEHYQKLTVEHRNMTSMWLASMDRSLLLIGWRKVKVKRGGKQMVWKPRLYWITGADLVAGE